MGYFGSLGSFGYLWVHWGCLLVPLGPLVLLVASFGPSGSVSFVQLLISFGPSGTLWTHLDSSWSLWPRLVTGLLSPFGAYSYLIWGISLSLSLSIYIYIYIYIFVFVYVYVYKHIRIACACIFAFFLPIYIYIYIYILYLEISVGLLGP